MKGILSWVCAALLSLGCACVAAAQSDYREQSEASSQTPQTKAEANRSNSPVQFADATEPTVFTAEEIDTILTEHPGLYDDVKQQIAQRLQQQGTQVSADQITDQALEQQIAASEQLRAALTVYLSAHGYRPAEAKSETVADETGGHREDSSTVVRPRKSDCMRGDKCAKHSGQDTEESNDPQTVQKRPPYALQSLQDLYTQVPQPTTRPKRFGSEFFMRSGSPYTLQRGMTPGEAPLDTPVGPDYVVGVGDALAISVWGASTQSVSRVVDRDGRVMLPEAGSVGVAGLTLAHAADVIGSALKQQLRNVQVAVTVARFHTVRVYVTGDVQRPGGYDISALATPLSALYAAGGPTAAGSLRVVRHMRGARLVEEIDLYDFLLHGVHASAVHMESGDTLLVPAVGPQVEITGAVRRAAIYELKQPTERLDSVIADAGGFTVAASVKNILVERIDEHHGRETVSVAASDGSSGVVTHFDVRDGDRVFVPPVLPYSERVIYVDGHVARPGRKAFRDDMHFNDVIASYADVLPEPAQRAEIVRLVPPDLHAETIEIDLADALAGNVNPALQPFDTIRIRGRYEEDAPEVTVRGEVLRPGVYPLSEGMTAAQLVRMAGGLKRDALRERADIASYSVVDGREVVGTLRTLRIGDAVAGKETDVELHPGDILSVHQITGWMDIGEAVTVEGEVKYPGSYGFIEGERLSSVLRRAGGFRPAAYPEGAVLLREQVRELETKSRDELVRQIEANSAAARLAPNLGGNDSAQTLQMIKAQQEEVLDQLKSHPPTGRLVIHLDNNIDTWANTDADIELRRGDVLSIPNHPSFVLVTGQVYNATAITFRPDKTAGWYLAHAGGANTTANRKEIFVIRANGSVVGRRSSGWFQGDVLSTKLSPGDVVVVPQKIIGNSLVWRNLLTTAQLASSIAITAAVAGL